MSQRLALFLGANRTDARELFAQAKRAYSFRSKVAHGRWKQDDESTSLTAFAESLVRRSLVRLLQDDVAVERFLDKKREAYLDELPFSQPLPF